MHQAVIERTGKWSSRATAVCHPRPPVALVSAVSSTTTLFVFGFGVLLTLFLPKFGREDLTAGNLLRKGAAALLVTAGVMLAGGQ